MFHYPALSVCDSWTAQDSWFELMAENWQNTLDILKTADPDQYKAIRSLGSRSQQQGAVREFIDNISASSVWIECKFDTLSGVIAQEKIQSIGLLKLDAEFADWEILNGVKAEDWNRIFVSTIRLIRFRSKKNSFSASQRYAYFRLRLKQKVSRERSLSQRSPWSTRQY